MTDYSKTKTRMQIGYRPIRLDLDVRETRRHRQKNTDRKTQTLITSGPKERDSYFTKRRHQGSEVPLAPIGTEDHK